MSSQEPDNGGPTQPFEAAHPPEPGGSVDRPSTSVDRPPTSVDRPGAQLLAERRAQGLSLGDVARQLKLSVRQVEALERDDYAAFPGAVFARGFLRNYAKLLQLDPEALVAQAAISTAPAAPATHTVVPTPVTLPQSGAGRRSRFGFGTLTLGLVLIIVVLAAIYDARNKPTPVSLGAPATGPSGQPRSPEHADSPPPSSPGTTAVPAAAAPAGPAAAPDAAGATATVAPAAGTTTAAAATAPAKAATTGVAEVKLSFDDESWVEIKDGTGVVIFSRLNPAGAEEMVSGEPPLDLVIGNARSVRLTYRNKPVDLTPHTRVDVARVRLE
jgi:cytoskeleton protein RodZ